MDSVRGNANRGRGRGGGRGGARAPQGGGTPLAAKAARDETERMLGRRSERLPENKRSLSIGSLTDEDRRILRMSQKEFNSFRTARAGATSPAASPPAPAPKGAGPATAGK